MAVLDEIISLVDNKLTTHRMKVEIANYAQLNFPNFTESNKKVGGTVIRLKDMLESERVAFLKAIRHIVEE